MKIITDVSQFKGGWFIGDFYETSYKTQACEVAFKIHYKDEEWSTHYHKVADEINYLLEGEMTINDVHLFAPCVFVIYKGEVSTPKFLTDVRLIVVKVPGVLNDKYEVKEN